MRLRITFSALLCLAACSGGVTAAGSTVRVQPVPLPDALRRSPDLGELRLATAYQLSSDDPAFGGLSGLLIEDGGLLALSDRAMLFHARVALAPDGTLQPPRGWWAEPVGDSARDDTESLSRLTDGSLVASAESPVRLVPFGGEAPLLAQRLAEAFPDTPRNEGVEGLATMPDGSLFAVAEAGNGDLHQAALVGTSGTLRFRYRTAPGFKPTGADRSGNWLLVLERRFSLLGGFESRIVALDIGRDLPKAGGIASGRELARLGPANLPENYEGLAVTPGPDGRLAIFIVADDNFIPLQRTLLLQLWWTPERKA
jgi:hypothetical protein